MHPDDEVKHPLVLAVETLLRAMEYAERCPEAAARSNAVDLAWGDIRQMEEELLQQRGERDALGA